VVNLLIFQVVSLSFFQVVNLSVVNMTFLAWLSICWWSLCRWSICRWSIIRPLKYGVYIKKSFLDFEKEKDSLIYLFECSSLTNILGHNCLKKTIVSMRPKKVIFVGGDRPVL